jgi:hypothetical protein
MSKPQNYLRFELCASVPDRKTKKWHVFPQVTTIEKPDAKLGDVYWFNHWRRYVYWPAGPQILDSLCLAELAKFCEYETQRHKGKVVSL